MAKKIKFITGEEPIQDILQENGDAGIIPLQTEEEAEDMYSESLPTHLPVLPLRNTVMFPGIVMPITVGRKKSIMLVEKAYKKNELIGIVAQLNETIEDPTGADLYKVGTLSRIIKMFDMPDGMKTVVVQGLKPFKVSHIDTETPYIQTIPEPYPTNDFDKRKLKSKEFKAIISSLMDITSKYIKLAYSSFSDEVLFALKNMNNRIFFMNFIISNLPSSTEEKQRILEIPDVIERAMAILTEETKALQMAQLKMDIQQKTKVEIDKQQKEFFLNQQMKTIQDELGNTGIDQTVADLKAKADKKLWDEKTQTYFEKELQKLQRMHQMSPDFTTQLNYLDLMVDLPWNEYTKDNMDLKTVQQILNEDHFGLEKIKERIVEYLAVLKLKGDMKSPILCFVGPPGVGKTSLGKSIARAMNRQYIRMSLGGVRDESEIRGHRKTYIGAMPGRIIQSIRKATSANPVFVLDEIDKLSGMNVQGDPSAAMLEVLDPEQNTTFYDNYLETTFDLSHVMFIATANTLNTVHPALIDRMEVIELSSYLIEEKVNIAKRHLIPRQITEHGLKENDITFSDDIIQSIITDYTREAGVRILEKQIAKLIRHRAFQLVNNDVVSVEIKVEDLATVLGIPLYKRENELKENTIGVAIGLAWTPVGGEVLFVETAVSEGKGNLVLTGNLGDVMKESATIAYEYLKIHASDFELNINDIQNKDVYIHIPEGATPKDGPSAGITLLTALLSTFTKKHIRQNLAMTGEITLRGKITPVGGIKEKILAAKRANITTIVLPKANQNDINDIEQEYIKGLNFHYFENMLDALKFNFQQQ
ncbi:MAG: endopeptidase La [Bacteroidales bacterium]|jgi:ATP-dependent Lon protease|nr:endopeptidase La [Bacteroidales bacterium]